MSNKILVIDDERDFLASVKRALTISGFKDMELVNDPTMAETLLSREPLFDIALIDISMPVMNGVEILSLIKRISPLTECIMVTARDEAGIAVECLKKGAYDYLVKPISSDDMIRVIQHALERKRLLDIMDLTKRQAHARPMNPQAFKAIVTNSKKMHSILREAELHSAGDMPILISGESGTGKELVARAIHAASPRAVYTFTPINMASLSENLFESAFFGHARGAFTGAQNEHTGFLEYTHRGTLFLDEIATLPLALQGKLLRVLQEKEFIRLGTSKPRSSDVRFIAATNADLSQLIGDGLFRKDIYYRLRGAQLHLPPLRERKEDIPVLIDHFLKEHCGAGPVPDVAEEAMSMLMAYEYPGNIRELRSIIKSCANLSQCSAITASMLPPYIPRQKKHKGYEFQGQVRPLASLTEMEKEHIRNIFHQTGGNLTRTAKLLAISLNTLRRKLRTYGIDQK